MLHGYAICLCHVWSCQLCQIQLRHMVTLHTELRHSASLLASLPRQVNHTVTHRHSPALTPSPTPSATASPTPLPTVTTVTHRQPHRHPPSLTPSPTPSATASPAVPHRHSHRHPQSRESFAYKMMVFLGILPTRCDELSRRRHGPRSKSRTDTEIKFNSEKKLRTGTTYTYIHTNLYSAKIV